MASCQAQCRQVSNQLSYFSQQSSPLEVRNRPVTVSFTSNVSKSMQGLSQRGNTRLVLSAAERIGSCCGGSEGSSNDPSCSSKAPPPGVAGVGTEFENMVSRSTMQEFEKEYDSREMQGTITRDVVADVMNEIPELLNPSSEEKFVDVDAVLNEARGLTNADFVFDSEMEGVIV